MATVVAASDHTRELYGKYVAASNVLARQLMFATSDGTLLVGRKVQLDGIMVTVLSNVPDGLVCRTVRDVVYRHPWERMPLRVKEMVRPDIASNRLPSLAHLCSVALDNYQDAVIREETGCVWRDGEWIDAGEVRRETAFFQREEAKCRAAEQEIVNNQYLSDSAKTGDVRLLRAKMGIPCALTYTKAGVARTYRPVKAGFVELCLSASATNDFFCNVVARFTPSAVTRMVNDERLVLVPFKTMAIMLTNGDLTMVRVCEGSYAGKTGWVHPCRAAVICPREQHKLPPK